ncbi:MAG: High-affinity branched-chain amino acid transport ATP-binding protein LivF [Elusimicrobia bacterium]|nr:High-affinity branched-chain amino acid transport ATP-binding protein LivF [Elusimicrobiota bacterium]
MLKVTDIHVGYGKIKALHGVSLYVDSGEVVTLIGANGSGKSSFLKALSGLLPATAGEIIFEGTRIDKYPPHEITRLGLVQIPEGRRIFPLLTVEENLQMGAFFRKDHGAVSDDMDHLYNLFPKLKERRKQLGGTLSGGEQQMLAFGRALMARPKLLALDEPSMGLAPFIVDKVFEIIRDINRRGVTILLVEQNARAALSVAGRGYALETGHVILEDTAKNLLTNDKVKQCYLGIQENLL